jgi:hypothetical protein
VPRNQHERKELRDISLKRRIFSDNPVEQVTVDHDRDMRIEDGEVKEWFLGRRGLDYINR